MQRNLDQRVEAVVPVPDEALCARLDEMLDVLLQDDTLAWTLGRDGAWSKVPTERGVNAQQRFQEMAVERARLA
jgi:polyphosphate kinase